MLFEYPREQSMDTVQGPLHNPFRHLSPDRRRSLTASLLDRAELACPLDREHLLEQVVLVNMCVASSIAARYRGRGVPADDLEQVAQMALVRCVGRFDPSRDRDLLAYLVPSVRGEVRRYFRDQGWMVRPSRAVQELRPRVIAQRNQGNTSPRDIAQRLGVETARVDEVLLAEGCFSPTSLDHPVGAGWTSLGDQLTDPSAGAVHEAAEARMILRSAVLALSPRDQSLLRMRYFEDRSQQDMADELGITQPQVSRLLAKVLGDLRSDLAASAAHLQN